MPPPPNILIGTLFSGENEFESCKKALQEQSFVNWQHFIISHQPNMAAHESLYRIFMERSDEFEIFVKYDADMVFTSCDSLRHIADLFHRRSPIDHVEFGVKDFFSDRVILGLHAFSSRCRWMQTREELFVDVDPICPTPKQIVWDFPAPIADHCPNPSPFQAFHFGVHRALKAIQSDTNSFDWFQFQFQWGLLKAIWKHFCRTEDRRLGMAILGADFIFQGKLRARHYDYTNPYLESFFSPFEDIEVSDLFDLLHNHWHKPRYAKRIASKHFKRHPSGFFQFIIRRILNTMRQKKYY